MEQKRKAIQRLIQSATETKIRKFENIRGKQDFSFPFWDIVVITAADADQKAAYDLQLKEKLARQQLPLGVKYHILKDPGDVKIGPGGSLMAALSWLQTIYNQNLFKKKVLFVPAGGFSQRLPSASILGKIFTAIPYGKPIYQMLELVLAMYIDLPAYMESGIFLACADTIILYDCTVGVQWSFNKPGITAFGHPAPIQLGTTHGVFLLSETECDRVCSQVHIVECEEFLHKRSADTLREKGALLGKNCRETLGISEDYVLVDGSYYIDGKTAKKMIDFYEEKSPLSCEIDSHGDFLHGLGKRGTNAYISDTSNVHKETDNLLQMRQEIYTMLQGTPLHVLVLPNSRFYHTGTTKELLYHYCDDPILANELSLNKDAFNKLLPVSEDVSVPPQGERRACIMNSLIPPSIDTTKRCIVEYCHIKSPCKINDGCIISNCVMEADSPDGGLEIPPNSFLHTAAVTIKGNGRQFVTMFFDIQDNLKKAESQSSASELRFLDKSLSDILGSNAEFALQSIFPQTTNCCLWNAKLFPPMPTMEESFQAALLFLTAVKTGESLPMSFPSKSCFSMADVMQFKDIDGMLEFRKKLYSEIIQE